MTNINETKNKMQTTIVKANNGKLSVGEKKQLRELEAIVQNGLKTFFNVGRALMAIRDGKLYRERFKTFEAYLASRWEIKRQRAYELMDAYEVAAGLPPEDRKNLTESQAAELKKAPAAKREEVLVTAKRKAAKKGKSKVTAKDIREEINERSGARPPSNGAVRKVTIATYEKEVLGAWRKATLEYIGKGLKVVDVVNATTSAAYGLRKEVLNK